MRVIHIDLPGGAGIDGLLHEDADELQGAICKKRPVMLICPGGGYNFLSKREADPPAMFFLNAGFQVFILNYHIHPQAGGKRPLTDLAQAVHMLRRNAADWLIDPGRIVVLGFSAGAHLACSLGVHWDDPELLDRSEAESAEQLRPDAMVLGYPVITAGEYAHRGSIDAVSRDCSVPRGYWSLEDWVSSRTPPTFVWHTMDDDTVPVENSLLLAAAMRRAGVPCECHLFEHGCHGLSVCSEEVGTPEPAVRAWLPLCRTWLERRLGTLPGV